MKNSKTIEFIKKAQKVHGDKYDYSCTEYIHSATKVKILCPTHGVFEQLPTNHLQNRGCKECGRESRRDTTKTFKEKAAKVHGDTYDTSLVKYISSAKKVKIICKEHGVFEITPNNFLLGAGCQKCGLKKRSISRRVSQDEFINACKKIHNNFYDYSETVYTVAKDKVKIKCPIHGYFYQMADSHRQGCGCNDCGNERIAEQNRKSTEQHLKDFNRVHNNFYTYPEGIEINSNYDTIKIICPIHGEFEQVATNHMSGRGCQKCGKESMVKAQSNDTKWLFDNMHPRFIEEDYDLSKIKYVNSKTKVKLKCNKHDHWFETLPHNLVQGHGCIKCGWEKGNEFKRLNTNTFIEKANEVHNSFYEYPSEYVDSVTKIIITCPKHGDFEQTPNSHLCGAGCSRCACNKSKGEQEVQDFLSQYIDITSRDRKVLDNGELDILLSSKNLAIEYNGLYWHSDKFLTDDYHLNKTKECLDKGIKLIHLFEDEWLFKQDIVKSRLLNLIGHTENKVYARKTEVREVETKDAMEFLNHNHIQGAIGGKVKLGLYYNSELVSIMTFGNLRKNMGSKAIDGHYELLRFCNKLNTTVIGGASKLLKHFTRNYDSKEIISYADRRWSNGELYEALGFKKISETKPNFFYIENGKRSNRFNFRKSVLVEQGFDKNKSGRKIMEERGYYRIYDSGTLKYKYTTLNY